MRRIVLLLVLVVVAAPDAWACPWCRPEVEAAVYNPDIVGTVFVLMLPLLVIALVGAVLHIADRRGSSGSNR